MSPHGAFHWNELRTRDADKAKAFYAKSLGWSYEPMDEDGNYWICMSGGQPVAGIYQMRKGMGMDDAPDHWGLFIAVDDLDRRLDLLKREGGKVVVAPWDVPEVGRIAMVTDSCGAAMGWMMPTPQSD